MTASVALPFMIGARTLWRVRRRLLRVPLTLEAALGEAVPDLPRLRDAADGYLINSLPEACLRPLLRSMPGLRPYVRQRYRRSFAQLGQSFDDYLAGFSAKSRSTLRRKTRRLAERSGGRIDLRCYGSVGQVDEFYTHARAVSARTYQERLLDAGLPEGEEAVAAMRALAARDAMRGWVLFLDERPISYLYAPAEGDTLVYAHLGYDPDYAELSPGTVLQFEAMRRLMEEGRFRLFDFTEGEGQHKRLFGTASVDCVDLLLLRPTLSNRLTGSALNGFDRLVAFGKRAVHKAGLDRLVRSVRR